MCLALVLSNGVSLLVVECIPNDQPKQINNSFYFFTYLRRCVCSVLFFSSYKFFQLPLELYSLFTFTENEYEILGIVYVLSTWIKWNWIFAFEKTKGRIENVSIFVVFIRQLAQTTFEFVGIMRSINNFSTWKFWLKSLKWHRNISLMHKFHDLFGSF